MQPGFAVRAGQEAARFQCFQVRASGRSRPGHEVRACRPKVSCHGDRSFDGRHDEFDAFVEHGIPAQGT